MRTSEFLGQVQSKARLPTMAAALQATRATLGTLAERLGPDESRQLGAQLPREIQECLTTDTTATPAEFSSDEFLGLVSEREGVELPEGTYHARAVIDVLSHAVSAVELIEVLDRLPADYARLFIGTDGELPSA